MYPLWQPSQEEKESALLTEFLEHIDKTYGTRFYQYEDLYRWSIQNTEDFWRSVWRFCHVIGEMSGPALLHGEDMEKAVWFPDAKLNYAENLLRRRDEEVAIYFQMEDREQREVRFDELYQQVSQVRQWLIENGVSRGDRVAGYLPNIPETLIAMLATTSLGAVWTSTSPDFGAQSVIERFGQVTPKVLITVNGYQYNGKLHSIQDKVLRVCESLSSIKHVLTVPLINEDILVGMDWEAVLSAYEAVDIEFEHFPFNSPLFILYSSGTTGKPKCIIHSAGGVLLQHLKEHQLHSNVRLGDVVFYYSTCGWMMWNWQASALASGASLVLYEGSPTYPNNHVLWDMAARWKVGLFGTSAKYLEAMHKAHVVLPAGKLPHLKTLCSTGSVLVPELFEYVYQSLSKNVALMSISGGTDICSCFVLGNPISPVYAGQTQCRGLAMSVEVFDDLGVAITGEKGELVCTSPFPSQPLGFWGDDSGEKYHQAYFDRFPGVWCHGDWIELTEQNGVIIYGRSDATLNPGGVRIGTAEIYRYLENVDEVIESVVIGQQWRNDVRVVLFVALRKGLLLDEGLRTKIRNEIRKHCTPRHVPAKILQISAVPRTKSGKVVELAVADKVHGREVKNTLALANPEALKEFENREELSVD